MLAGSLLRAVDLLRRRQSQREPAMEMVYREIFVRDLHAVGLPDIYYPVSSAANHSLLYLLLRVIRELQPRCVLELGAGQSTLLIDAVNGALRLGMDVTTVEHDEWWAQSIQARVAHPVVHAPLARAVIDGKSIEYYSGDFLTGVKRYQLVVIDGPPAHSADLRFSRIGCLDFLPEQLAEDFVIIIDDAQRAGERHLVKRLTERLHGQRQGIRRASIAGMKMQTLLCGGAYHAEHF